MTWRGAIVTLGPPLALLTVRLVVPRLKRR